MCGALRLDTGDYSFAYVARWASGNVENIKETGERVEECARLILNRWSGVDSMSDLRGRFGSSLPLFSEHISWLRPKPFRRHRNKSATERRHATDAFGSEHPLDAQRAVAWRSQRTTVASAAMAVLGAQQVPGEDEPNARNAPGEAGSALCFTLLERCELVLADAPQVNRLEKAVNDGAVDHDPSRSKPSAVRTCDPPLPRQA